MVKKHWIYYTLLLTALIVTISAFTTGFFVFSSGASYQAQCSQLIGEELPPNAEIVSFEDSHNGFLSDGETLAVLRLTDEQERDFVYGQGVYATWHLLNRSLNEKLFGDKEFSDFYQKIPFNQIKKGYYTISDKQAERGKQSSIAGIFNRNSIHFTMGIYDMENNLLYVYALDINRNITPYLSNKWR